MNSVLADFVGLLGPGQIVDRHALVAVPAGFLKVRLPMLGLFGIIC